MSRPIHFLLDGLAICRSRMATRQVVVTRSSSVHQPALTEYLIRFLLSEHCKVSSVYEYILGDGSLGSWVDEKRGKTR